MPKIILVDGNDKTSGNNLESQLAEMENKRGTLEKYWNTIISVSKSAEVNFGSLDEALNYIVSTAAGSLLVSRISIWKYHPEMPERIECIAAFDRNTNRHFTQSLLVYSDNEPYFKAIKTEKVISADNALDNPDTTEFATKYLQPLGIKSLLDAPFFLDGKLAGVLCCEQQGEHRKWSGEDIIFATSMAEVVSIAFRSVAQKSYEKDLEAFSYSVAHDLRSPLRMMLGYTNILGEDYGKHLDEEGHRLLRIVKDNATHMWQLVDSLLDFSRLNKHHVKKQFADMAILIKSVIEEQSTLEGSSEVKFLVSETINLTCDATLIRQVFSNLISNAVKYSSKKVNPTVEISSYKLEGEIIYTVRDNGAGFDMKYIDKLFKVFHRLHGTSDFPGTGVGLAIVHRIVNKHGGRVWAESKVDEGATFYFSLPSID